MLIRRIALGLLASLVLGAAAARQPNAELATGRIVAAAWPYLGGSLIPLRINGFSPPFQAVLLGPGRLLPGGIYEVPAQSADASALLVAGNGAVLATVTLRTAPPPPAGRALVIVASYDDGLMFHDARDFRALGVLATGGTPSDVAVDALGRIATTDTDGTALTIATLSPWSVAHVDGVVLGDEIAIDRTTGAVFVTDRDWNGSGALTRVDRNGAVVRVATGATAEGLAIDDVRQMVYVANANDATVTVVNARTMRVARRFHAVSRIFSLALSADGLRLYGISNQSTGSPFGAAGAAVIISLRDAIPRVIARSADLEFPVGIALDAATHTLFVTDEAAGRVYVLDARSLRPRRSPLRTCATPWEPALDAAGRRLYVPCAGANAIDAFDERTLRRVSGAPFPTGSYPLAVAVWHPQ